MGNKLRIEEHEFCKKKFLTRKIEHRGESKTNLRWNSAHQRASYLIIMWYLSDDNRFIVHATEVVSCFQLTDKNQIFSTAPRKIISVANGLIREVFNVYFAFEVASRGLHFQIRYLFHHSRIVVTVEYFNVRKWLFIMSSM